jgi:hypothetical protein
MVAPESEKKKQTFSIRDLRSSGIQIPECLIELHASSSFESPQPKAQLQNDFPASNLN